MYSFINDPAYSFLKHSNIKTKRVIINKDVPFFEINEENKNIATVYWRFIDNDVNDCFNFFINRIYYLIYDSPKKYSEKYTCSIATSTEEFIDNREMIYFKVVPRYQFLEIEPFEKNKDVCMYCFRENTNTKAIIAFGKLQNCDHLIEVIEEYYE